MTSRVYFKLVRAGAFLQQSRERQLTNLIGGLFIRPEESEHVNDMTRFNQKRNTPDITVHVTPTARTKHGMLFPRLFV